MARDALAAHARDELGITDTLAARPFQAALASAISFVVGGVVPLLTAVVAPEATLPFLVGGLSLAFLPVLGGLAARWRRECDRRRSTRPILGSFGNGTDG
jgi:VIT1/CCC1 family predicted Fe2+/Mn2+ transporter